VTSTGPITDSGALSVEDGTTLAAGANSIVLDTATNDFNVESGGVLITSGGDVTLVDANKIDFATGNSVVTGNLAVTAGGAITDTGDVTVTGTSNFATGGAVITLDVATNDSVERYPWPKHRSICDTGCR